MEGRGEWPTGRMLSAVARRIEREWNAHLAHWDLNHASLPVLAFLSRGRLIGLGTRDQILAQFGQPSIEDVFVELQRRDEGAVV